MRVEVPPPPANGQQFLSGEYVMQPGEDKIMCVIETYDGPDIGVRSVATYQSEFGHHVAFLTTPASADDYPDRVPFDCTTNEDFDMTLITPSFVNTGVGVDGTNVSELPDGMATLMKNGTRVLIQSHYINTSSEPILVRDGFNLDYVPEAEVETWAAAYVATHVGFQIPAQQEASVEFDCTSGQDINLVFLLGHMHDWGASYEVDLTHPGGEPELVYEVQRWESEYRDVAPINEYGRGEFPLAADDVLTTRCMWNNDTDHALALPQEMCATVTMAYPAREPILCVVTE